MDSTQGHEDQVQTHTRPIMWHELYRYSTPSHIQDYSIFDTSVKTHVNRS